MTLKTKSYSGRDLRTDIHTLIEDCQREAIRLTALARRGCSGYRAKGRADACNDVAVWLERISRDSVNDLPIALNDFIQCLQQSVEDERSDTRPKRRRISGKRDVIASRRCMAAAQGRASTYAHVHGVLSHLLALHYPNQQFPLTLTGRYPDDNEDEWSFDASSPQPSGLSPYEHVKLSSRAEPVGTDMC